MTSGVLNFTVNAVSLSHILAKNNLKEKTSLVLKRGLFSAFLVGYKECLEWIYLKKDSVNLLL